jgi:tetratricopeptide (TPR) repeat protein
MTAFRISIILCTFLLANYCAWGAYSSSALEKMVEQGKAGEILDLTPWDSVSVKLPGHMKFYVKIASRLYAQTKYEQTINTYLLARKVTKNPALYALKVAGIYRRLFDYKNATIEYLVFLDENPLKNYRLVQSQIFKMMSTPDFDTAKVVNGFFAFNKAITENRGLKDSSSILNDTTLLISRFILVELFLQGDKFDKAISEIKKMGPSEHLEITIEKFVNLSIEKGKLESGIALLDFYLKEKRKDQKIDRFSLLLARLYKDAGYREKASALINSMLSSDKEEIAGASFLLMADLLYEKDGNFKEALRKYRAYKQKYLRKSKLNPEIGCRIVECLIRLDSVVIAVNELKNLEKSVSKRSPEYCRIVMLQSECQMYLGNYEAGMEFMNKIAQLNRGFLTNDALYFMILTSPSHNISSDVILILFRSRFLAKKGLNDMSLALLDSLKGLCPTVLKDDILCAKAELLVQMGEYDTAVKTYIKASNQDSSLIGDRALYKAARLYEISLQDAERAAKTYQELLANFPNSHLCSRARKRIKLLKAVIN